MFASSPSQIVTLAILTSPALSLRHPQPHVRRGRLSHSQAAFTHHWHTRHFSRTQGTAYVLGQYYGGLDCSCAVSYISLAGRILQVVVCVSAGETNQDIQWVAGLAFWTYPHCLLSLCLPELISFEINLMELLNELNFLSGLQRLRIQALVEMTTMRNQGRRRRFAIFTSEITVRSSPNSLAL